MKHVMTPMLILLCAALARMAFAQQPPARTASADQTGRRLKREGVITGRVIGPDGQPMADARVFAYQIGKRLGSGHSATVDDDGNFKMVGLSPTAYVFHARAPGYVFADLPIEDSVHRIGENVTIRMVKGGVITGRVTDETGEPLVGVTVRPHRLRDPEGSPAISSVESLDLGVGNTDDRGIYRVFGLRPGVYIVSIGGQVYDEQVRNDAPTYYPSATRDTATEINLRAGEEVSGVDIRHRGDRGRAVSGVVTGEVESSPQLRAHLVPAEAKGEDDVIRYAEADVRGDGSFEFKHVAPDKYLLHARQVAEKEASDDQARPAAWDAAERAKLRREAMAAKNEIELQPCGRVKDYALKWR